MSLKTAKLMEALERMEQQEADLAKLNELLKEMAESRSNVTQDNSMQADLDLKAEQLQEALAKVEGTEVELKKLKEELDEQASALEEVTIDKEALEASLEELDAQHQKALQQMIASRNSILTEHEQLKQEMAALKNQSTMQQEQLQTSAISDEAVDKEIASLREQLIREQSQQDELKEKLKKAAHSLNDLHMDKQDLQKANTSLNQKVSDLSAKIKDISLGKAELQKSYEAIEAELNKTKLELNNSMQTTEHQDLASEILKMKSQLEESQCQCESFQKNVSELEGRLESLQNQLAEVTGEKEKLEEELNSSNSMFEEKSLIKEIADLHTQNEALQSEKVTLQQDMEELEQKMHEQKHHYETFIQQMKEARVADESGLEHQVEKLAKCCYDKDHTISELESTLTGLRHDLQDQKELLQATLDGQTGVKELLADKEAEITKLQVDNQSSQEAMEERGYTIKYLEAEIERLQTIESQHKACHNEVKKLHTELDALKENIKHHETDAEAEGKDARTLDVITDLESEISSLKLSLEKQTELLSAKDTYIAKISDSLAEKDKHVLELENRLLEQIKTIEKSQEKISMQEEELNQMKHKQHESQQTKAAIQHTNGDVNDNDCKQEEIYLQNGGLSNRIRDEGDYEVLQEELEELRKIAAQKDAVITELRVNNSALLKMLEDKSLQLYGDKCLVDIHKLDNEVKSLRKEKEQIMSVLNEKSRENSNLKSEVHKLMNVVSAEKNAISKLQKDNNELMRKKADPNSDMTKETVKRLSQLIRDKDLEIESLNMKTQTLLQVLQGNSQDGLELSTLIQERDNLVKQVTMYQQDREQIIQALNQKHQESVAFHAEVQRLTALNSSENQELESAKQQYVNLTKQYEDKQKALLKAQNDLLNYKEKYSEMEGKLKDSEKGIEVVRQATPPSVELRQSPPPGVSSEDHEHLGSMVRELRKKLSQKEEECREKDSVILQNGAKLKETGDQLQQKEAIIGEKSKVISDMNVKLREVKESVREKEIELSAQKKKVENLTFQLQGLQAEVGDLQGNISQLNEQRSRFQSEIIQMKEANNRLNVTVGERDLEVGALKEKLATLTQHIAGQAGNGEEKGTVDQRMAETEAMQKQAQLFQQERDQAMTSLRAKQMDLQQLQHQV